MHAICFSNILGLSICVVFACAVRPSRQCLEIFYVANENDSRCQDLWFSNEWFIPFFIADVHCS